jgi:hypothetical protein
MVMATANYSNSTMPMATMIQMETVKATMIQMEMVIPIPMVMVTMKPMATN